MYDPDQFPYPEQDEFDEDDFEEKRRERRP